MKARLSDDEKRLWKTLGSSYFSVNQVASKEFAYRDLNALETIFSRERSHIDRITKIISWISIVVSLLLCYGCIEDIMEKGFRIDRLFKLIFMYPFYIVMAFRSQFPANMTKRWKNAVELLVELSKLVPEEKSIGLLMQVMLCDDGRVPLSKNGLRPVLYHRVAQTLADVADWKPTDPERRLLQKIALSGKSELNERRYPDELRVAALLALADEPAALDERFRAKISALTTEDATEDGVKAAMQEVLRRV